ncbi:inosine/xanthosine triphosphatase [Thermococcus paralvinellae]|uniref:Probable inosine/xanthosine triphosphatase n=1 Tax=Thermococcus paralvinellae TaxID=582419 RepID=W0I0C4_9EURY|nr:inosine/xanthosine triphosphatase [Thermococcus paralvinellae]AHF79434.1 putative Inosine/xanthosine triphosphatase [Thermococcus paralvinellae]
MRVAVGSTNPTKVKAVEEIMREFYENVEVIAVEVDSEVGDQPIGLEKTIEGAINRARKALNKTNADLGVGIEAGLYEVPYTITGYMDIQFCAIVDREGRITLGHGPGFEYPPYAVEQVLKEIAVPMSELSGDIELKKTIGAIGFLTRGKLLRKELNKLAVLMAMIPRINEEIYFGQ